MLNKGVTMKSPLELDKANVKEYKVPAEVELHPRQKLAFLEDQLNQIKALHWRSRVDMLHAARLQEDDNPTLRDKGYQNMAQHRNEVQQTIGGIMMINKLINELKDENKDLGETKATDHPDGF
jgi:hypothetical protein